MFYRVCSSPENHVGKGSYLHWGPLVIRFLHSGDRPAGRFTSLGGRGLVNVKAPSSSSSVGDGASQGVARNQLLQHQEIIAVVGEIKINCVQSLQIFVTKISLH